MTDYNCFDPAANVDGIVANPNWKTWLCNWGGKFPSSFSGSWYVYDTPVDDCPGMPRTPQFVTWSRWKLGPVWNPEHMDYDEIIDAGDCSYLNIGPNYKLPNDYEPNSGERHLPFALGIPDPLVPSTAPLSIQARAVRASGTQQDGMGPDIVISSTCSENSFYMLALIGTGPCLFRIEITGVSFDEVPS